MVKKGFGKATAKKASKKASAPKAKKNKRVVEESVSIQAQESLTSPNIKIGTVQSAAVTGDASVEERNEETKEEAEQTQPAKAAVAQKEPEQSIIVSKEEKKEQKEEVSMGEEEKGDKGLGKTYNPSDFSHPTTEAAGGSKVFLYVGISVVIVAVIVASLFFVGGLGKSGKSGFTGASVVTAYCTDTDGGYNRFTKGVADGTYYLNYEVGQFMDECAAGEDNKLTEYYCKNDLIVYATEPCPEGMTCQAGICA